MSMFSKWFKSNKQKIIDTLVKFFLDNDTKKSLNSLLIKNGVPVEMTIKISDAIQQWIVTKIQNI